MSIQKWTSQIMLCRVFRARISGIPVSSRRYGTGDRILPAASFLSWNPEHPVKLHFREETAPDNYPPILVQTMFRSTVERHPDRLAIVADRSGMEWHRKWTFERLVWQLVGCVSCHRPVFTK
jgi:hypothetical protein